MKWVFEFYFQVWIAAPLKSKNWNVKSDSSYFVGCSFHTSFQFHYLNILIIWLFHLLFIWHSTELLSLNCFCRLAFVQEMCTVELIFLKFNEKMEPPEHENELYIFSEFRIIMKLEQLLYLQALEFYLSVMFKVYVFS